MGERVRRYKNKILVALVALFTMLMCTSIGFATWITTSGDSSAIGGNIEADDVQGGGGSTHTPENLDVVTISTLNGYQYSTGYGFVNDDVCSNSTSLTGTCLFNSANGKKCFTSFRDTKSFKLDITLSTSLSGGFSGNNFTSNSISLTSSNFSVSTSDPVDSTNITTSFTIVCNDNNSDFSFDFAINLTYGGSSFPNLSSANINIKFEPKENA